MTDFSRGKVYTNLKVKTCNKIQYTNMPNNNDNDSKTLNDNNKSEKKK